MFNSIVLLSGPAEQLALPPVLLEHNPRLTVIPVGTAAELVAMDPDLLRLARLIAFVTPEIVPNDTLNQLGYGAINFHPGPPAYRGWAPAHFALYDQATEFGVTAHIMVEKVDAGAIIETELFAVPADISVFELEKLAYVHLARLFWRLAKSLATEAGLPPALPVEWSGKKYSRRVYRNICEIPLDIPKEEFDRRIRAFGGCDFGISPTIYLHGTEFRAVPSDSGRTAALADAES